MRDPLKFMRRWYDKYGEISWTTAFGIKMVYMTGPDANQFVFQNKNDIFSNNQGWDFFIGKFFHRGIMLLDFEEHHQKCFLRRGLFFYAELMLREIEAEGSR